MGSGQATFPSRLRVSRGWFPLAPSAPARAARDMGLFWTRVLLALAGSTALAPCSFPAPLTFLAVQGVGPQPRVAGARPRVPKPVPGAGVSIPSQWPGEQRGSAAPHGLLALGFSLGHPAAQAPQNPRTLGQEGPQEGAQSFRTSSLEPAGSSQAEPGHPLIWGGSGQPCTQKGGVGCCGWKHSGPS